MAGHIWQVSIAFTEDEERSFEERREGAESSDGKGAFAASRTSSPNARVWLGGWAGRGARWR